jgi:methyl-accepting chemotaxis protein
MRLIVKQAAVDSQQLERLGVEMADLLRKIRGIAAETNILSLNASIEASRGAEGGRSFHVIANRVKQLANQTADLAGDADAKMLAVGDSVGAINQQLLKSLDRLASSDSLAAKAQTVFHAIGVSNATVRQEIDEVTADMRMATERMRQVHGSVADVAQQSMRIEQDISNIAAMSQQQAASLHAVSGSSDILVQQNREMQRVVSVFSVNDSV